MKICIFALARINRLNTIQFTHILSYYKIGITISNFKVFFAVDSGESREVMPSLLLNFKIQKT